MSQIGILDIGLGNIRSVFNAVYEMGFDPMLISQPEMLNGASHLILPGVGNFAAGMRAIHVSGMMPHIQAFAASGQPLLGICLGMQLLASAGFEGGQTAGLNLIEGEVVRISEREGRRIPHVGWNEVAVLNRHPLFEGIRPGCDFYFVHSYHFVPRKTADILATTDYMEPLVCAVGQGNLAGLQFHPEKSQANGLRVIENFCNWDGRC